MWGHFDPKDLKQFIIIYMAVFGLRCGNILVARIRSNFCQHTMNWERLELKGIRGKGIAWKGRRWMWMRMFLSACICWAPMWTIVGCFGRDWNRRLRCGTIIVARITRNFSISIGCFGRDSDRRESKEKALLGKVAGGVFLSLPTPICWAPMWDHCGRKD